MNVRDDVLTAVTVRSDMALRDLTYSTPKFEIERPSEALLLIYQIVCVTFRKITRFTVISLRVP